jgi:hypothetical protein
MDSGSIFKLKINEVLCLAVHYFRVRLFKNSVMIVLLSAYKVALSFHSASKKHTPSKIATVPLNATIKSYHPPTSPQIRISTFTDLV